MNNSNLPPLTDCSTCRFHTVEQVPKTVEVSFDEFIETSDETESMYFCKHEKHVYQVGRLTILCSEYEPPLESVENRKSKLDEIMNRFNNRTRNKE